MTFPSLCRDCNNVRLGGRLDPTLVKLVRDVRRWIDWNRAGEVAVTTKPLRLMRAVAGQLLAAEEGSDSTARSTHVLPKGAPMPQRRK